MSGEALYERYKDALRRGHVASLRGRLEEALTAYAEAAAIAPERATPHTSAGTALMRRKRPADAVRHYTAAVRLSPRDEAALLGRAQALAATGSPAAGRRRLRCRGRGARLERQARRRGRRRATRPRAGRGPRAAANAGAPDRAAARVGAGRARTRGAREGAGRARGAGRRPEEGGGARGSRQPAEAAEARGSREARAKRPKPSRRNAAMPRPPRPTMPRSSPSRRRRSSSRPRQRRPSPRCAVVDDARRAATRRRRPRHRRPPRTPCRPRRRSRQSPCRSSARPSTATCPRTSTSSSSRAAAEDTLERRVQGVGLDQLLDLASAYRRGGHREAALDTCYLALSIAPDDVGLHLALVELYDERGWATLPTEKLDLLDRLADPRRGRRRSRPGSRARGPRGARGGPSGPIVGVPEAGDPGARLAGRCSRSSNCSSDRSR